jgi:hypothetical protein
MAAIFAQKVIPAIQLWEADWIRFYKILKKIQGEKGEIKMAKKLFSVVCLTLIFYVGIYAQAGAGGNLRGQVIDPVTKKGVQGVFVIIRTFEWLQLRTYTDKNGFFTISKIPYIPYNLMTDFYHIEVRVSEDAVLQKYCQQTFEIPFKMEIGKDTVLEPIILKDSCRLYGNVKLWDGRIPGNVHIAFHSKNGTIFDTNSIGWNSQCNKDGSYRSDLLPQDAELVVGVSTTTLSTQGYPQGYYWYYEEIIKTNNTSAEYQHDIIIPNFNNELSGQITDLQGKPVPQCYAELQEQTAFGSTDLGTDANGFFSVKNVMPSKNYSLTIYLDTAPPEYNKTYAIHGFEVKKDESQVFNIQIDPSKKYSIQYKIVKK